MKAHCNDEKILAKQRDSEFPPASLEAQEFISVPLGTFAVTLAVTQDLNRKNPRWPTRCLRIQEVKTGGTIDRFPAIIAAASAR
jgi:hypothetical protein